MASSRTITDSNNIISRYAHLVKFDAVGQKVNVGIDYPAFLPSRTGIPKGISEAALTPTFKITIYHLARMSSFAQSGGDCLSIDTKSESRNKPPAILPSQNLFPEGDERGRTHPDFQDYYISPRPNVKLSQSRGLLSLPPTFSPFPSPRLRRQRCFTAAAKSLPLSILFPSPSFKGTFW